MLGQGQVQVIYTGNQLIPAVRFKPVKMDMHSNNRQDGCCDDTRVLTCVLGVLSYCQLTYAETEPEERKCRHAGQQGQACCDHDTPASLLFLECSLHDQLFLQL